MTRGGVATLSKAQQVLRTARRDSAAISATVRHLDGRLKPVADRIDRTLHGTTTGADRKLQDGISQAHKALTDATDNLDGLEAAISTELAAIDAKIMALKMEAQRQS